MGVTFFILACAVTGLWLGWRIAVIWDEETKPMTDHIVKTEQINPSWIKPTMTLQHAANQAALRGYYLKASWSGVQGIRIVAVPRDEAVT